MTAFNLETSFPKSVHIAAGIFKANLTKLDANTPSQSLIVLGKGSTKHGVIVVGQLLFLRLLRWNDLHAVRDSSNLV